MKDYNVTIYYNSFYKVTNSIGRLWYARNEFNTNEILIANADVYYTQELLDIIFEHNEENFLLEDVTRIKEGDYFFRSENEILLKYGNELRFLLF